MEILERKVMEIRAKYGDERRTEIQVVSGDVDIEDLIPEEDCVITLTHLDTSSGSPAIPIKSRNGGGRGISGMKQRDEDFVEELVHRFQPRQHPVFDQQGKDVQAEMLRDSRGKPCFPRPTSSTLALEPEEKVTSLLRGRGF